MFLNADKKIYKYIYIYINYVIFNAPLFGPVKRIDTYIPNPWGVSIHLTGSHNSAPKITYSILWSSRRFTCTYMYW